MTNIKQEKQAAQIADARHATQTIRHAAGLPTTNRMTARTASKGI